MGARDHHLTLIVGAERLAVTRLRGDDAVPEWAFGAGFVSITRTSDELSIVCTEERVPSELPRIGDLVALRVVGTLAPDLVGVLASLANPLADAGVPILAIGTHDTDYVLVQADQLGRAVGALRAAGHHIPDA